MQKILSAIIASVALLGLVACQSTNDWGTKQTIGTGAGALGGGLLGSQVGKGSGRLWATGAGVLLGGLLGSEIGKSLDSADKAALNTASTQAYTAPIGKQISWNNPQSGNSGTVVPVREGTDTSGAYCREFQQTIVVGGQSQKAYGQACRAPDGQWQIVN